MRGLGFRVKGFRIYGFGVLGLAAQGFRDLGSGALGVWGSGFRVMKVLLRVLYLILWDLVFNFVQWSRLYSALSQPQTPQNLGPASVACSVSFSISFSIIEGNSPKSYTLNP